MREPTGLSIDPAIGLEYRKLRVTVDLMDRLVRAATSRGYVIDWGEPDDDGFYTPTVLLRDRSRVHPRIEATDDAIREHWPVDHAEGE